MNIQPMDNIPRSRSEFERNINTLANVAEEGKLIISNELKNGRMFSDLMKVRTLPNERINFLSVEVGARLLANISSNFQKISEPEDRVLPFEKS